jgi:hypothetical protein
LNYIQLTIADSVEDFATKVSQPLVDCNVIVVSSKDLSDDVGKCVNKSRVKKTKV